MFVKSAVKLLRFHSKTPSFRQCHNLFGLKDIIYQDKLPVTIRPVVSDEQEPAIEMLKWYYLPEHALLRDRDIDLVDDRAMDAYLASLLKQGNSVYAKTRDGIIAGLCVCFASSLADVKNLREYAFYRQDPNTKDFFYFTAKLQETPNLWELFKEPNIFEIKMLAVLPEYRRQGLATMLVEKALAQAQDQEYKVIRMDCINPYDYKIAERCMLKCLTKYPLHKLRGTNAPFIKCNSENNRCVRVYVNANELDSVDKDSNEQLRNLKSMVE